MQRLFCFLQAACMHYGNVRNSSKRKRNKKKKKKGNTVLAYLAQVRSTKRAKGTLH